MASIAEIAAEMLPTAKVAVRTTYEVFDPEVEMWVQDAISEMLATGVSEAVFDKGSVFYPKAFGAVVAFCKAHFGQDNPNEEMRFWQQSYEMHVAFLVNNASRYSSEGDAE